MTSEQHEDKVAKKRSARSATYLRWYHNLTPEQHAAHTRYQSEHKRKRFANLAPEEREARLAIGRARQRARRLRDPEGAKKYMQAYNIKYCQRKRELFAKRPRPEICECCGEKPPPRRQKTLIVCDHNQRTQKFRGWICQRCNVMLGMLNESVDTAKKLIAYIERTEAEARTRGDTPHEGGPMHLNDILRPIRLRDIDKGAFRKHTKADASKAA